MLGSVRSALALLDRRSKRILLLLVAVQVALAAMDLAGVLLIGLVAALGASAVSGETPGVITQALGALGLSNVDEVQVAIGLAVAAGFLFIAKSAFGFLLLRRSLRFLANRQAVISSSLADQLLSRPLLEVQRRSSQETAFALTQGVNSATIGVLGNSVVVASEFAVLLALTFGLLVLDPVVALFTILFFTLIGLILNRVLGNWARRLGDRQSSAEIRSVELIQNSVRAYREVAVSGRRGLLAGQFRALRWSAARYQADTQIMIQVSKYVFEVALVVGGGVLAASQLLMRDSVAAIATIAVFLAAASRIMPSLLRVQQSVVGIRYATGLAGPLFAFDRDLRASVSRKASIPELLIVLDQDLSYPGFKADVRMDSASLHYPGNDVPAVDAISFDVRPGESLALVGPSGAGKSTVADLLLGVLDPDSGSVVVSGEDPRDAVQRWPGAISYVPQDVAVINGSVRENVALGVPAEFVEDELVWQALTRAHLDGFLRNEREGLDTVVGEHGVRLSGGQRQRLGLARALYSHPRLLVLDEATSALDAETEEVISQALGELAGEVTLVIIAHRLATIRYCSQIAYMEAGRILAIGTFDEVREAQPRFDRQAELLGL